MSLEDILIKRAAAGDKEVFEQLVDKYKGYVFAIILNLIRDSFYAEIPGRIPAGLSLCPVTGSQAFGHAGLNCRPQSY